MIARQRLARFLGDRRGIAAVEFAILAPVMILMMMGFMDLVYQVYAQSVLDGAVQKAGRDSAIEGGAEARDKIDDLVLKAVKKMAPNATFSSTRKSYSTFQAVKPEKFIDANNNKRYDSGECFDDTNGNKRWDADPGLTGQGGANDVVVYVATIEYPRMFPMPGLVGWSRKESLSSKTVLKNQPFASQRVSAVTPVCS